MSVGAVFKRLPAGAVLICDFIMAAVVLKENSEALAKLRPVLRFLLPAALFALLIWSFVLLVWKDKKLLFRLLSLAMLFGCNVFASEGTSAQTVMVVAFALDIAEENIQLSRFSNFAVTAVAFFVSISLATFTIPYLHRVETPKMVTDLETTWFSLIEEIRESRPQQSTDIDPNSAEDTESGNLTGNVITNDPFDPEDPKLSFIVTSSCPLDKLMIFSCYDYDPEGWRFTLASPNAKVENSSTAYYTKALSGEAPEALPCSLEIADASIYTELRAVPFCDFRTVEEAKACRDGYVFKSSVESPQVYSFTIDPDAFYKTASSGYGDYVLYRYTSVPSEFRQTLMDFLEDRGIEPKPQSRYQTVREITEMLEGYEYSNEPPELPEGEDPVMWFITESHTGYSKHFAAAQTLLFRVVGIPARYCYGYLFDAKAGEPLTVTEGNAYAFCQVFLDGRWMAVSDVKEPGDSGEDPSQGDQQGDIQEEDPQELLRAERMRRLRNALIFVFAAALLAALLGNLFKKYAPDKEQRMAGAYRTLRKFYFIGDDVEKAMIKSRYSREGASEEDALLLEGEVKKAKELYVYKVKLLKLLALCIYVFVQKLGAVIYNMSRNGKEER